MSRPIKKDSSKKVNKINLENSPDSEKFDKNVEDLSKYIKENSNQENELLKYFLFFSDISKKTKYQGKILETPIILKKIKDLLLIPTSNSDITMECVKIILNLSKNRNGQAKMLQETVLTFNELFEILLVNLNTNLTFYILSAFSYLTESNDILDIIQGPKKENIQKNNLLFEEDDQSDQVNQMISKIDLTTITRTFVEKILDDLNSNNKKMLLKVVHNLYTYNKNFIVKDAIEPIIRCLGNKNNDVVISALKILLFFTHDKTFHNDLINANFIFRLVRTYKQGIDEMDVVIVKILNDLFENKNLYEILFENNVLLILSNYLTNFEVEKNEKYEEVIRNVFEIFKLINKNTDEENGGKSSYHNIQNPLIEDENLQTLIFKKAYSLAAFSKSENSILSCLSLLQIMLLKFSSTLLNTNDSVKSIIELVPPFFKNKNLEIIKYSLSIFELILNKKSAYFQETYAQSSNQTFSIKSLVHSIINLVNEFSSNYELLSMSCRILVNLSDIPKLQPHFLQEPQITVLKVFNDNLLKQNKQLAKESKTLKERIQSTNNTINERSVKNTNEDNINNGTLSTLAMRLKINTNHQNTQKSFQNNNSVSQNKNEERDKHYLIQIEKKVNENTLLLKDSLTIISNLSKNPDNLEILTLKGFLDVITEKLNDNDTETLPYVIKCIQGFCQGQSSIDIILKVQIISKILTTYKLYKNTDDNNLNYNSQNNNILLNNKQDKNRQPVWTNATNRLEVLQSLKNILESDIKLQRTFIIERGIEILLNDVSGDAANVNEIVLDQLNEMILRVIYVVSCNINKLFLIYFSNEDDLMNNESDSDDNGEDINDNSKSDDSDDNNNNSESEENKKSKKKKLKLKNKEFLNNSSDLVSSSKFELENDNENNNEEYNSDSYDKSKKKENLLKIFTEQLSEKKFMNKLIEVGEFDINSLATYKELTKILINLYLNRYYLKYFTLPRVFDKVIIIINNIMKKYKENVSNENNYEILKLVIIFLKFICEDENLIKKFLKEDVISILISSITQNEFSKNIKEEELEQFYYNFSLVLLRLTEFTGHVEQFKSFPNFFQTLEKLYDINLMNGKIYIISIIRNIIAEKQDFFNEDDLTKFLNKIVSQSNTFIIYEFVELIKNLVHNRAMCKRMENVFKYLVNEIKSNIYSSSFKKKMLDLILCLSYENANIRDYALHDLLSLVKNLDVNINQKTTLLILMNFSSISSNFSYLMQGGDEKEDKNKEGNNNNGMTIKKKDFINVVNHLIDSDRFSQILIQRLLINITSIDGIDMSIISDKIMKVLVEILQKCKSLQENIIIFALATLVNVSNRNILKFDRSNEEEENNDLNKDRDSVMEGYEGQDNISSGDNEIDTNKKKKNKSVGKKEKDNKEKNDEKPKKKKQKEPEKEIIIVDYILENLPDILDILQSLFNKENLDISSLTIMFSCNLLRKIKFSKFYNLEKGISTSVEKYVEKEPKLNSNDNGENLLNSDSGKFLLISIIKYCICLSIENNNKGDAAKYRSLTNIIMRILKDNTGILRQFTLNLTDIKENTINFACVENQLNFFNMIISLAKQKDNKYFFTYNSYSELRNFIGSFFVIFIKDFSDLMVELSESENKSKIILINDDKEKDDIEKKDNNSIKNTDSNNNSQKKNTENNNNNNNNNNNKVYLELNQSFQNVLINTLKLLIEYFAEIQIISNHPNDNKIKAIRKKIHADFYNNISESFEKMVKVLLQCKPKGINDELKSLLIYVLFLVFSNNIEDNSDDKDKEKKKEDKIQIETSLTDNIDLEKWLMKIFVINNNSIQNDFFCLKIFTISIHGDKFPDIFYQSSKFIKKLINYLKYSGTDKKKMILQKESERVLNIISFNPSSHPILYSMGIYNIFKTNLFVKAATSKNKNTSCQKEDFILLVNMILNKNNKDFIQDDIKSLLQCIFPCKDLANNLRVELFDVFMSTTVEVPNEKKFHEDYLIIFNLLYDNLKESFSEMIFLFDKFTKTYQNFAKKFLSEDSIVIKIFYDFLKYDQNFPSKPEELNCYLKILELFCEVGEISDNIEKMVNEMMYYFTRDEVKGNLRDINILNAILNFSFLFFVKYCEKRSLDDINLDNSIATSNNTNTNGEGGSIKAKNNNVKDNKTEEKLVEFIQKFHYNKLVDIIITNSIKYKEINPIYVLTMLIIQDDYKGMLLPLKTLNSYLFKRDFLMSFLKTFFNFENLEIKEFVFVIHIAIILSNVGNTKLEYAEEFVVNLIDIYDKYILPKLVKSKKKIDEENNENDPFNDTVTSIYFFCDLVKTNEISSQTLGKVLKFIMKIIISVEALQTEQKEILIRYYQEILLHYRINSNEELISHLTFMNKIHSDKDLNFIEFLAYGTILINTRRDILLTNLGEFLNMISVICLSVMISTNEFNKRFLINYFKFCKQICLIITNNNGNSSKNGFVNVNSTLNEQSKQSLSTLETYINNSMGKYMEQIREDPELNKKYEKIKGLLASSSN